MTDTVPGKPSDLPNWQQRFLTPGQTIVEPRRVLADGAPDELHLTAKRFGMSWEQAAGYMCDFSGKVIPVVPGL